MQNTRSELKGIPASHSHVFFSTVSIVDEGIVASQEKKDITQKHKTFKNRV